MQPFAPALEDLLEHLEDLDRRLRPPGGGAGAAPAGDLLLQKSDLAEIYDLVDALIAGIRSIDAGYRRCRNRFAHLPAGCICTGQDGAVLEANLAAGALLGLSPDRLQGFSFRMFLDPRCVPAFQSAVADLIGGEEVPAQEYLLVRSDGSTIRAALAGSVAHDPESGAIELLWVVCNTSGQKKAEQALREGLPGAGSRPITGRGRAP
jgi:PAS domain S-box-containing protein